MEIARARFKPSFWSFHAPDDPGIDQWAYKGGSDIVTLPSSRRVDGIVSADCVILGVVELEMSRHGGIRDDLRDSKSTTCLSLNLEISLLDMIYLIVG